MTKIARSAGRPLVLVAEPGADQPGDACSREDPHEAQQNQESAEDRAIHHQRGETVALDGAANRRKLKSDEDEDQPVQNKVQRFPDGPDLDANRGREESDAAAGQEQAARDNGQHARGVNLLRRQIGGVGDQNAEGDLDGAIVDAPLDGSTIQPTSSPSANAAAGEPGEGQDAGRLESAPGSGRRGRWRTEERAGR